MSQAEEQGRQVRVVGPLEPFAAGVPSRLDDARGYTPVDAGRPSAGDVSPEPVAGGTRSRWRI